MTQGAYVASSQNVSLKTEFAGVSGYFKGKGLSTTLATLDPERVEKTGMVFFASVNGPIRPIHVKEGEPVIVDNEALVGYTQGLECELMRPGNSTKSLFLSGEGFVCQFKGDGIVFTGSDEISRRDNLLHTGVNQSADALAKLMAVMFTGAVFIAMVAVLGVENTSNLLKKFEHSN